MNYEWDEAKALANYLKHGVLFADAVGVFEDEAALSLEDRSAVGERRFIATGLDYLGRVLTVVYTFRQEAVRLISARQATRRERRAYEGPRF